MGIQCIPLSYFVVYSSAVFLVEGSLLWCSRGIPALRRWLAALVPDGLGTGLGQRAPLPLGPTSLPCDCFLYYCNSYCRLPETSTGEGGPLHQFLNTGIKCNTSGVPVLRYGQ